MNRIDRYSVRAILAAGAAMVVVQPAVAANVLFDIPAQPLPHALLKFGLASKTQVVFDPTSVRALTSAPVKGNLSADRAISIMLTGSRLAARANADSYVVVPVHDGAAAQMSAPPADAGTQGEGNEGLVEIVVTAQRREQRLQDVPMSATVTTGEALTKSNVVNLEELAVRLPNVRITAAPGANLLNIRGVGSGLNPGFEQAVGTFVDGVYRGRSRAINTALFDLQRVEVLKGPQTTFFGNNTIAGALNITTRKPSPTFGYNASALYAPADGEHAYEAGVTGPLSSTLNARIAAKAFGMDGYVANELTGDDEPRTRNVVTRASLAWEPADNFRSDIRVDYGRMRGHGGFYNELQGCPPDPAYGAPSGLCGRYLALPGPQDDRFDYHSDKIDTPSFYEFWEAAATHQIDVGEHRLTSITSYFDHENKTTVTAAPLPVPGVGGMPNGFVLNLPETLEQWTQELRWDSPAGGFLEYSAGLYYARGDLDAGSYTGFYFAPFGAAAGPPYSAATPIAGHSSFRQKDTTRSAFASLTINPLDALLLSVSGRYSIVRKNVLERDFIVGTAGPLPGEDNFIPGLPSVQEPLLRQLGAAAGNFDDPVRTDKKLMPAANLQYEINDQVNAYLSYTKGFKAGGYSASTTNKLRFGPETVDAYEVGLKGYLFDHAVYFSLAAFQSDYDDLQEATQVVQPNGVIIPQIANVGEARAKGVELGLNWRVTDRLSLVGDVAALDARYIRYPNAPCTTLGTLTPGCVQDMAGKRRGFAPKWSGNVGLSMSLPLNSEVELRFDPNVYFTSRYFQSATADPLLEQHGWAKLDLRLAVGAEDGSWELALIGKNVTDKATASFRNVVPSSTGTYYVLPERPRSVAVQFSMRK